MMEDIDAEAGHWRFQMEGVELNFHLFDPFGSQELPHKARKVSNGKNLLVFNEEARRSDKIP
ncbi:Protein CBG24433 [Caenorhabditis briggsae]|uniref:Protein CBG24433 n=1 Tax=Caenorhabditis briggsae TaxID=6238 RepID=A8WKP9_CAEBR|nr:Protein CBG24433 [Caenorhabditis briggsae]CAP21044.2 Protein CBG24433 [Caenorhabditis briggsae]